MSYQALRLDGNGYASIADASQTGLDMGFSDFMVEMRVKLTVPTASQPETYAYFFDKWVVAAAYEGFMDRTDETIYFIIDDAGPSAYAICSSSYLDDLKWHSLFFVADRDQVTGLELYVDGIEVTYVSQTDPTSVDSLDNDGDFAIGAANTLDSKLNGQLDEVHIWNFGVDGLPADYAAYITWRATGRNVFLATSEYDSDSWASYVTNNLSAYYKFDGDYTDETSNSNDLTVGGTGNTFPGYTLKKQRIISPRSIF